MGESDIKPSELLAELPSQVQHQHQFVIPVEWLSGYFDKDGQFHAELGENMRVVTKLRCTCGAETTRKEQLI